MQCAQNNWMLFCHFDKKALWDEKFSNYPLKNSDSILSCKVNNYAVPTDVCT